MEKTQIIKLIKETFDNSFNENQFTKFIISLFPNFDTNKMRPISSGRYIYKAFKEHISSYKRIGQYCDPSGKELDVLIIKVKNNKKLEQTRTALRNFAVEYLVRKNISQRNTLLCAYYADDSPNWRLSFTKKETHQYQDEKGNVRIKQDITSAKRYSFLVGEEEPSHTAKKQFLPLFSNKTGFEIEALEAVFNIESVTKEFFEEYKKLFLHLNEELDKIINTDEIIRIEFEEKHINSVNFVKKLLGQIVFLYFLQKKGWLGVQMKSAWGTGPKNFLRQLFNNKSSNQNYFNDLMEPLFYEALAVFRPNAEYKPFNCKIPFLNGGLFEPINEYDWRKTDIVLPDKLFSNTEVMRDGIIGTGILDVFDRYNFTVKEDEPLEKEVAVDPEMLGKVFENMLEVKDRKSKGAFYTPREIVHYMCQESLINYLDSTLNYQDKPLTAPLPKEQKMFEIQESEQLELPAKEYVPIVPLKDIETFIRYGDFIYEHETAVIEKGRETKVYKYKMPETIRKYADNIDNKLANVLICDPAIGSGAFPVGIMNEIVRARKILNIYKKDNSKIKLYDLKRHTIQKSIYGVDIDPSAIEIAKLRLWLSLIVDEEEYENIKPLPNLDYKIMQGNSLIEDFHGISLEIKSKEAILFDDRAELDKMIEDLYQKQNSFFNAVNIEDKKRIKEEIENSIVDIFHHELKKQKSGYFSELNKIKQNSERFSTPDDKEKYYTHEKQILDKKTNFDYQAIENELKEMTHGNKIRNFFPWKLYFADIFRNYNGFDIVIANPPYITIALGKKQKIFNEKDIKELKLKYEIVFEYKGNTYSFFLYKSLSILKEYGTITYIIPNTLLLTSTFSKTRKLLLSTTQICKLIDIKSKIFDNAEIGGNLILISKKNIRNISNLIACMDLIKLSNLNNEQKYSLVKQNIMLNNDEYKIYLDLTSMNLMNKIKNNTTFLDTIADFYNGIKTGNNKKYISDFKINDKYKPVIRGRDINKYMIKFNSKYVYFDKNILWSNTNENNFKSNPKIVIRQTSDKLIAALDTNAYLTMDTTHLIFNTKLNIYYLLGLLNSKLLNWYHQKLTSEKNRTFAEVKIINLKKLPLKIIKSDIEILFINIITRIINSVAKSSINEISVLENKIDIMVYKLYELTYNEAKTIDPDIENIISENDYNQKTIEQLSQIDIR